MEGLKIDVLGQKAPYSECNICRKVANKKPALDTGITHFEKLYNMKIGSSSSVLCRGCLRKLAALIDQY